MQRAVLKLGRRGPKTSGLSFVVARTFEPPAVRTFSCAVQGQRGLRFHPDGRLFSSIGDTCPISSKEKAQKPAVVVYQDGLVEHKGKEISQLQFWENDGGVLVAQHDEINDIDGCKWAISRVCQRIIEQPAPSSSSAWMRLMTLRFLLDLEERVEQLSGEGLGTCAVELFERPWVLALSKDAGPKNDVGGGLSMDVTAEAEQNTVSRSCRGMWKSSADTEVLRFGPQPDSVARRVALAALSPVVAPLGALIHYVRMGGENSMAGLKWYLRAVTEMPCRVVLDSSYQITGTASDLEFWLKSASLEDVKRLIGVRQAVPQLTV